MEKDFEQIEHILMRFNNSREYDDYKEAITNLQKGFNIEPHINFNIFTAISDKYRKENLHSDILGYILDPHTEKIGNIKYIEIFKRYLEKKTGKEIALDLKSVTVERETGRIDLLIKDGQDNCIIMENKINDALDREDQIGRYFQEREAIKRASVQAIVYLAKTPWKKLDREYSISDPLDREKIEKMLLEIPVVNKEGESSFIDVLNECKDVCRKKLEAAASDNIPGILESKALFSYVFLDEYISLLKHLGGGFMAKDLDTQAMYKIFSDKDTLDSFRVMGALWEKQQEIIPQVFKDYFLKSLGFSIYPDDENTVFKNIKEDVNIGLDVELSFGFVYTPGGEIKRSNRIPFKNLLEDVQLKKYFVAEEAVAQDEGWWVYKTVDWNQITCLDDLKILVEKFEKLITERL